MIIPVNNELTAQVNLLTITLWAIALVWLIAMLIYRRQRVSIRILSHSLQSKSQTEITMTLRGFIDARHAEGLESLELWLISQMGVPALPDSVIPHSVDSTPRLFEVSFDITHRFANQAMNEQQTDGIYMAWILSANMGDNIWLYAGLSTNISQVMSGGIPIMKAEPKTKGTRRKINARKQEEREMGVISSQFYKMLAKVSQPIKKSEKGKS